MRVILLWPTIDSAPALIRAIVPLAQAAPRGPVPTVTWMAARATRPRPVRRALAALYRREIGVSPHHRAVDPARVALALLGLARFGAVDEPPPFLPGVPRALPPRPDRTSRWSGSLWLVARGGAGLAPGVAGGQLGGSQTGARVTYALDRRHRLALAGRVTTPLGPGLREAALGVEWQPTRLPLRIVAEQRFALNAGKGGPALGAVGGVGPLVLGGGFRLEAYGQAGVIDRTRAEPYVDGAARTTLPLATIGKARLSGGAGVWAAAQRGATRVDLGPALTLDLPLAQQTVRVALEYRARVAGDARPGSGLALTLGTDF